MTYNHRRPRRPSRVAEPVQVYLQLSDQERLNRLTDRLGTTKSDVLRRGLEALEALTAATTTNRATRVQLPTFQGLGLCHGADLDDNAALLDVMEGEAPTETD